jgi:hypothetical protein
VEDQRIKHDQVVSRLESLIVKIRLQSPEFQELDIRVSPAHVGATSYVVDISKERISKRVPVGSKIAHELQMGRVEFSLTRDLRTAMMTVMRQARERTRTERT